MARLLQLFIFQTLRKIYAISCEPSSRGRRSAREFIVMTRVFRVG